jgi:transcriptional regulator with XRE-family HTH domain
MISSEYIGIPVGSLADLGAAVRRSRKAQQLRIDDAAGLCGVSTDVLSRLENGIPITTHRLFLILEGLGMRLTVADPAGADGRA